MVSPGEQSPAPAPAPRSDNPGGCSLSAHGRVLSQRLPIGAQAAPTTTLRPCDPATLRGKCSCEITSREDGRLSKGVTCGSKTGDQGLHLR